MRSVMRKYLICLPFAVLIVACGGGGGEAAKTSQDCFNEGFWGSGSRISISVNYSSNFGVSYQEDETYAVVDSYVEGGEIYATVSEPRFVQSRFSLGNGYLKEYGYSGGKPPFVSAREITPPKVFPVSMDIGQTVHQSYFVTVKSNGPSGPSQDAWDAHESRTYVGREVIKTSLGAFEACQFKIKENLNASSGAASSFSDEKTVWIAAGGSYRGLVLKTETVRSPSNGARSTTSKEVVKVNVFNVN